MDVNLQTQMRNPCVAILLIFLLKTNTNAQSFYNGSFETTSFTTCMTALYNVQFNGRIPNVFAFGSMYNYTPTTPRGRTSVHDSTCLAPPDGKWCVGLRSHFDPTFDAIALELTTPLDSGELYYISFYLYGNLSFHNFMMNLDVGESLSATSFGNFIYTVTPDLLAWKNVSFSFTSTQSSKYITVKNTPGYGSWTQVDKFVISRNPIPLGIEEQMASRAFSFFPNPATDHLTLRLEGVTSSATVELFNELGQCSLPKQVLTEKETGIDLSALSSGIYFMRVTSAQKVTSKKIIISR